MNFKINSITIGIAVNDIKESTKWYKLLLGDVETMEPAPGMIELKLTDNVWLQLDDTGYLEIGGGSTIIRLETDNIETAYERVSKIAFNVENISVVEGIVKYFDFKDQSGNKLSYVQLL